MKLTVEDRVYELDRDSLTNVELMAIEDVTGLPFQRWIEALDGGSLKAITALVWIMRVREEPGLVFADVVFRAATLDVDLGDEESGKDSGDPSP